MQSASCSREAKPAKPEPRACMSKTRLTPPCAMGSRFFQDESTSKSVRQARTRCLRGDVEKAEQYIREAVEMFGGDERSVAVASGRLADILFPWCRLDEALTIRQEKELPAYERLGGRAVVGRLPNHDRPTPLATWAFRGR